MSKPLSRRQQAFLGAYRVHGSIEIAQVSCELHYNALRVSQTYYEVFAAIEREHSEALVEQAQELAEQGPIAPVY